MKNKYAVRRELLRKRMFEHNIDALFVSCPANRFYLSGFELQDSQCNESSGYLIITQDGKDMLLTDSRYTLAAETIWDKNHIYMYKSQVSEFINALLKKHNFKAVGFDEEYLNYKFSQEIFKDIHIMPSHGLVEGLRVIKDADEIQAMRESAKLNHQLMEHLPHYFEANIHKGITEADVAWYIESYFRNHGASENAFQPIVGKDTHAALPHYRPSTEVKLTENCLVLVDVGARYKDYNSDQTRTFWIGNNPSQRFKTVLEQVQTAQQEALKILKPGITGKDAYMATYTYFEKLNVEKYFTHNLGHGIGLETHEAPRLAPYYTAPLEKGMIVSVEPGLYYGQWGGIRWEYMALITEEGYEIL